MKKRFFRVLLAIFMIPCMFIFAACGDKDKDKGSGGGGNDDGTPSTPTYVQHTEFADMVSDVISSFRMKDTESVQPVAFAYTEQTAITMSSNDDDDLFDKLMDNVSDLNSHEYGMSKTWFEGMCTSIFTYPLGTSDALKNVHKEENLYDVTIKVNFKEEVTNPDGTPAETIEAVSKMVIQSKSDTHKVIFISNGENCFTKCDLHYFGEGNFNFEYIDIKFGSQGVLDWIDYCYGDSLKNVVEIYASESDDFAFATWHDGLTCLEYVGTFNDIIEDCVDEIIEEKNPAQYKEEAKTLYETEADYSMDAETLNEFMLAYMEDILEEQQEELGKFYSYISDNCLYGLPEDFNEQTLELPDDIDSFSYGLTLPSCVDKVIVPDNVKYVKIAVSNYNHWATNNGYPEHAEPEFIDNGSGINQTNFVDVPIEYVECWKYPLFYTTTTQNLQEAFDGEIQFSTNSLLFAKNDIGLSVKISSINSQSQYYTFKLKENAEEFLNEILPQNLVINTTEFDYSIKDCDRFDLKVDLYDKDGNFIVQMNDGCHLNNIQEDKDIYSEHGVKIMRFDYSDQKMYWIDGGSETWIYDYSNNEYFPIGNTTLINTIYGESFVPYQTGDLTLSFEDDGTANYKYMGMEGDSKTFELYDYLYIDDMSVVPTSLRLNYYNNTLKDGNQIDYFSNIESGNLYFHNGKTFEFKNGNWVRVLTEGEMFYSKFNKEDFVDYVLDKVDLQINILSYVWEELVKSVDIASVVEQITINSNEKFVNLNFLKEDAELNRTGEYNKFVVNFTDNSDTNSLHTVLLPYVESVESLSVTSSSGLRIYSSRREQDVDWWLKVDDLALNGNFTSLVLVDIELDDYTLNLPESCAYLDCSGQGFGIATPTLKVDGDLTVDLTKGSEISVKYNEERDDQTGTTEYSDFAVTFDVTGKTILKTNLALQDIVDSFELVKANSYDPNITDQDELNFKLYGLMFLKADDGSDVDVQVSGLGAIKGFEKVTGQDYTRKLIVPSATHEFDFDNVFVTLENIDVKISTDPAELTSPYYFYIYDGDNIIYITFIDKNDATRKEVLVIDIYQYKSIEIAMELYYDGVYKHTSKEYRSEQYEINNIGILFEYSLYVSNVERVLSGGETEPVNYEIISDDYNKKNTYRFNFGYLHENITIRIYLYHIERALQYYVLDEETGEPVRWYSEWFTAKTEPITAIQNPFEYCEVRGWYTDPELTQPITEISFENRYEDLYIYADATNFAYTITYNMPAEFVKTDNDLFVEKFQIIGENNTEEMKILFSSSEHTEDKKGFYLRFFWDAEGTEAVSSMPYANISFDEMYERFGNNKNVTIYGKFVGFRYKITLNIPINSPVFKGDWEEKLTFDSGWSYYFWATAGEVINLDIVQFVNTDNSNLKYDGWDVWVVSSEEDTSIQEDSVIYEIPSDNFSEIRLGLRTLSKVYVYYVAYWQEGAVTGDYANYTPLKGERTIELWQGDKLNVEDLYELKTNYTSYPQTVVYVNRQTGEELSTETEIQETLDDGLLDVRLYYSQI